MTFINDSKNKLENLALALNLHLRDIEMIDDDGIIHYPQSFTFAFDESIHEVEITYEENFETDGTFFYSINVEIPA